MKHYTNLVAFLAIVTIIASVFAMQGILQEAKARTYSQSMSTSCRGEDQPCQTQTTVCENGKPCRMSNTTSTERPNTRPGADPLDINGD
jgi:hypothetical protein